jgi:hypothetical protein
MQFTYLLYNSDWKEEKKLLSDAIQMFLGSSEMAAKRRLVKRRQRATDIRQLALTSSYSSKEYCKQTKIFENAGISIHIT